MSKWRTLFFLFILRGTRHCTFPCTEHLTWQSKILTLYRFRYRVRCHVTQESLYRRVTQVTHEPKNSNIEHKFRLNFHYKNLHIDYDTGHMWPMSRNLHVITLFIGTCLCRLSVCCLGHGYLTLHWDWAGSVGVYLCISWSSAVKVPAGERTLQHLHE